MGNGRKGGVKDAELWVIHAAMPEPRRWSDLEILRQQWRATPVEGRASLPKYDRLATLRARWKRIRGGESVPLVDCKDEPEGNDGDKGTVGRHEVLLQLHHNNVLTSTLGYKMGEHCDNFQELLSLVYAHATDRRPREELQRAVPWLVFDGGSARDDAIRNFVLLWLPCEKKLSNVCGRSYVLCGGEVSLYRKEAAALSLLLRSNLHAFVHGWPNDYTADEPRVGFEHFFGDNFHLYLSTRAMVALIFCEKGKDSPCENAGDRSDWPTVVKDSLLDYAEDLLAWHTGLTYGLAKIDEMIRGLFSRGPDYTAAEEFLDALPSLLWNPGLYEEHSITAKWLQFETAERVFGFRYLEEMLRDKLEVLQNALILSKLEAIRFLLTPKSSA